MSNNLSNHYFPKKKNGKKIENPQVKSDVNKALNYFTKVENQQVFVVGHSIFMKKLYKILSNGQHMNQNINDKFKKVKNQNVWSWIFDLNYHSYKKNIIFTRHAFSVADVYKERLLSHMFGAHTKFLDKSFYNQQLEKDAKLSLYGIITTINYSAEFAKKLKNINEDFIPKNNCVIIVSCLIRTWMTALCLYLPIIAENPVGVFGNQDLRINLFIGEYIKEDGNTPDNLPESINLQIKNITLFLKFLKKHNLMSKVFEKNVIIRIDFNIVPSNNSNKVKTVIIKKVNNSKQNQNKNLEYYSLWHSNTKNTTNYLKSIKNITSNKVNLENIRNNQTKEYPIKINNNNNFKIVNLKILGGIEKPQKDGELSKISRWLEPFSKKTESSILGSLTGRKNSWKKSKINNSSSVNSSVTNKKFGSFSSHWTNGDKKPVKKTITKKTVKSPVKKTTTKKTVKK